MEAVVDPMEAGRRRLKVLSTWTPEPSSRTSSMTRPGVRTPGPTSWTPGPRSRTESRPRPGQESKERARQKIRSESTSEERNRMEANIHLLQETRRQVKKESRVLERTRLALIRDINTGTRDMRAMGARLHKVT